MSICPKVPTSGWFNEVINIIWVLHVDDKDRAIGRETGRGTHINIHCVGLEQHVSKGKVP